MVCLIPQINPKGIGNVIMNVFSGLNIYGESWKVSSSRNFNAEEIAAVRSAEVVSSEYGNSVCFMMQGGGKTYIPLSNDSTLAPGDSVDMAKAELLTLSRSGSEDINRVKA